MGRGGGGVGGWSWTATPIFWEPIRPPRSGGQAEVGVLGQRAGHAYLGAAFAEDGELGAPVDPAAGQRRMPLLLQVHRKVPVHGPAAPLPLDLRLHLRGAGGDITWSLLFKWHFLQLCNW